MGVLRHARTGSHNAVNLLQFLEKEIKRAMDFLEKHIAELKDTEPIRCHLSSCLAEHSSHRGPRNQQAPNTHRPGLVQKPPGPLAEAGRASSRGRPGPIQRPTWHVVGQEGAGVVCVWPWHAEVAMTSGDPDGDGPAGDSPSCGKARSARQLGHLIC